MYNSFLKFTGLIYLSETNQIVLLVALGVACSIIGLVTDNMLRSSGFGPVGNGLIVLIGFAGCAILFNNYASVYKLATMTNFVATVAIGPLVLLIILAFLKRGMARV
jgi:hypothetical protein